VNAAVDEEDEYRTYGDYLAAAPGPYAAVPTATAHQDRATISDRTAPVNTSTSRIVKNILRAWPFDEPARQRRLKILYPLMPCPNNVACLR